MESLPGAVTLAECGPDSLSNAFISSLQAAQSYRVWAGGNEMELVLPAGGGFLVPENLRADLLRVSLETSIVRPRARVIPMESNRVPFPMIDWHFLDRHMRRGIPQPDALYVFELWLNNTCRQRLRIRPVRG